uniref:MetQ/NlpA family ABC transporter substrate-binding protein n=1 Tax=Succinimonas sp. TaxID=1936151 RepID=UPI003868F364
DNGLIKLTSEAGLTASVKDVAENPKNLQLVELEAAQLPRVKDQMAMVVLNGNYALTAGFNAKNDAVALENADSMAALTYVNVIAVREGNENNPLVKSLVSELRSDHIREFIEGRYSGAVQFYREPVKNDKPADEKTAAE